MKIFPFVLLATSLVLVSTGAQGVTSRNFTTQQTLAARMLRAMELYEKKDYRGAAQELDQIATGPGFNALSISNLYDSACIYALNGESEKAFSILKILAEVRLYTNLKHLKEDEDLLSLHAFPAWQKIVAQVEANLVSLPVRTMNFVRGELEAVKALLNGEAGLLWGVNLWNDRLLVLSASDTVYSLKRFPGSRFDPSGIYVAKLEQGILNHSNAVQKFNGNDYAVVMTSYLNDNSATLIHELFHIVQFERGKFQGGEVGYLDEKLPRLFLRCEYQALRNALQGIQTSGPLEKITEALSDATYFRTERQKLGKSWRNAEIDLESLEGIANYTGFKLSMNTEKAQLAITDIGRREAQKSFTRNFPYATGPAYGLVYDFLGVSWRKSPGDTYDFAAISREILKSNRSNSSKSEIRARQLRCNYDSLLEQENRRETDSLTLQLELKKKFVDSPTLTASLRTGGYTQTTDIDRTTTIKNLGTVFQFISGKNDPEERNFGNFSTLNSDKPTQGVLRKTDGQTFVFGLPIRIEGRRIIGNDYEITLAPGWVVKKVNKKGDLAIVFEK